MRNSRGWTSSVRFLLLIAGIVLFAFVYLPPAHALIINVPANDTPALIAAFNTAFVNPGPHTINLGGGTYTLTVPVAPSVPVFGDAGLRAVDEVVTVNGNGSIIERSAAAAQFRLIIILGPTGNLTLNNLTLRNGYATGAGPIEGSGGAISNVGGTLTLNGVTLTGNESDYNAGSLINAGGIANLTNSTITNNSAFLGGGIYNTGLLTLQNTTVSNNQSDAEGGGINHSVGTLNVNNSTISLNTTNEEGGGIANSDDGIINITDSTITANSAVMFGGGLLNFSDAGVVTILRSTFSNNTTNGNGGGISSDTGADPMTITNSTITGNSAQAQGGGIDSYATLTITNSVISSNLAGGLAGGIANVGTLTIQNNTRVQNNSTVTFGGGIVNAQAASVTNLSDSTVSGNTALIDGGGLYNETGTFNILNTTISGNSGDSGGGIVNFQGTVNLTGSTVTGNTAASDGGGLGNDSSSQFNITNSTITSNSAVSSGGAVTNLGTMTIIGSTFSGNQAAQDGGGILNWAGGDLTINGSTITNNQAANAGGGILNTNVGTSLTINNSSIRNNRAAANNGGGISNITNATMNLNNSTIAGNTSALNGGGLRNNNGTATIDGSLFTNNTAAGDGGAISSGLGTITVTNSRILINSAAGNGDGIYRADGTLTVTGSCIVGNAGTSVFNALVTSTNFTGNWWGAADGPSGDGPGIGDSVNLNVDFTGFLAAPIFGCPLLSALTPIVLPDITTSSSTDVINPNPPTCADLSSGINTIIRVDIPYGTVTDGGVYCRLIAQDGRFVTSSGEIGVQSVLDAGVISAVDVFGMNANGSFPMFNHSIKVCLPGSGGLMYLDATQAPRTPQWLPTTSENGFTCGTIPHAGTVVLVQTPSPVTAPITTPQTSISSIPLTTCRVTTTHMVNFRAAPSTDAQILTILPYDLTLDAIARTDAWFNVIYGSDNGWVNAAYLTTHGSCG